MAGLPDANLPVIVAARRSKEIKMKNAHITVLRVSTAGLLVAVFTAMTVMASHSVVVTVPILAEEATTWCGPAVGEMVMEGYPAGACNELQADVWQEIDNNRVEAAWHTDPAGMAAALNILCPPTGSWYIHHKATAAELMYSVAFWMTNNSYPVAVVLDTTAHSATDPSHQEHWAVIKGIVTDVTPIGNSSVTLEYVFFNDPVGATFGDPGVEHIVTGGVWYSTYLQAVAKPTSAYDGEYVAVIEPPKFRGFLKAKLPVMSGRIISPERAFDSARKWVESFEQLREMKPFYRFLRAEPMEPVLVDPKYGGYYMIPFTNDGETAELAVLINAYTGEFAEAGAFAPVRYLSEKQALQRAGKLLRIDRMESYEVSRVYAPEAGSVSRFHPVYKVRINERTVSVRQNGASRLWPTKIPIDEQR
jgi:hypothetical protein